MATQDTVTELVSAIRKVALEVPGAAYQISHVCTVHDYAEPGKPKIYWDDPRSKESLVSALVNDANTLWLRWKAVACMSLRLRSGAAGPGRRSGCLARGSL